MRTFLILLILSKPAMRPDAPAAQTSVGFAEPQDISTLLDYRLPDWSYRAWDVSFDLNGRASEGRDGGSPMVSNQFASGLDTGYFQAWESEVRDLSLNAGIDGHCSRSHDGRFDQELSGHYLDGALHGSVDWVRYLGGGPFSFNAGGSGSRSYAETARFSRQGGLTDDYDQYARRSGLRVETGLGWGRVRNVVPLVRAQRLSERLVALRRPALTPLQVQRVAQVLAQEYGYRSAFDRPDRLIFARPVREI
jgi:hypothetical protein